MWFSKTHLTSSNVQKFVLTQFTCGASATNDLELIHNYKQFEKPQIVSLFPQEKETETKFTANGSGYIHITCNNEKESKFNVVYVPTYDQTVLLPDAYKHHFDCTNNDNGRLIFYDPSDNSNNL